MLHVVRVGPMVTVQASPRRGHARYGVPASGPLDDEAMRAALAAVGMPATAGVLELPLNGALLRAGRRLTASIDGEPPFVVESGETFEVPRHTRAVRYLAIDGGLDVPHVLGSRATLVSAGLGGYLGRALRAGDALPLGEPRGVRGPTANLELVDEIPFDPLLSAITFEIDPRSDRVGTRLRGAALEGGECEPSPLVPGAVQVPPDGNPIVIGPDGPTTGGYRVIGVLGRAARDRLSRLRPRSRVTLSPHRG